MILVEDANAATGAFCIVLKNGLSNAAHRIAGRATTMTSANEIKDLCEAELNRSFASAKAELDQAWQRVTSTPTPTETTES